MDERYAAIRAAVEDWKARFPLVTQAWLHQSEDGTRIWLTDGQDGPVLAEARLPVEVGKAAVLGEGRMTPAEEVATIWRRLVSGVAWASTDGRDDRGGDGMSERAPDTLADLAAALARAEAAEDRAADMQTSLDLCLADLQALEMAARDVVSLFYDAGVYADRTYHSACRECGALIGPANEPPVWTAPPHRADCLVVTLMALLEETP